MQAAKPAEDYLAIDDKNGERAIEIEKVRLHELSDKFEHGKAFCGVIIYSWDRFDTRKAFGHKVKPNTIFLLKQEYIDEMSRPGRPYADYEKKYGAVDGISHGRMVVIVTNKLFMAYRAKYKFKSADELIKDYGALMGGFYLTAEGEHKFNSFAMNVKNSNLQDGDKGMKGHEKDLLN